jgi:hypothetical protein
MRRDDEKIMIACHEQNLAKAGTPMKKSFLLPALTFALAGVASAAITSVVETGGDNEATDTITARFSGQTFTVSIAGEPIPGAAIGSSYTVGVFGSSAPAFVDRNHRYLDDPGTAPGLQPLPIPAYLVGNQYIMSGNDNRDNTSYSLLVTVDTPSRVFMLIDNRMSPDTSATDNLDPPTFGPGNMQWIVDQGWLATNTGLNRFSNSLVPDEVPIDEGADGSIQQWYSVYYRDVPAGNFTLLQADNAGQNMYGVVVMPVPEPATGGLALLAAFGLLRRRR